MMETSEEVEAKQRAEEFRIVQKKLSEVNELLKPFTIEQIREAAAKAQEEKAA